jgi:hypothetical protein
MKSFKFTCKIKTRMKKTRRNLFVVIFISSIFFISCDKSPSANFVDLDLMSYEMPIVIKAPADAEIKKMDLIVQRDITVKSGDDYYVQIFESDMSTSDPNIVKEELLKDVQENPYFNALISEESNGFIYKTMIDSTQENYGFRYVRIQGDKEYTFQTGMIGQFSLEQVKSMYEAVK